ncbi:hypothetical protein M1446_02215 [Candidatus Dependentiae bacterium]|nr:hypothetical protein [Candidatus Dependentiae bacterium]
MKKIFLFLIFVLNYSIFGMELPDQIDQKKLKEDYITLINGLKKMNIYDNFLYHFKSIKEIEEFNLDFTDSWQRQLHAPLHSSFYSYMKKIGFDNILSFPSAITMIGFIYLVIEKVNQSLYKYKSHADVEEA